MKKIILTIILLTSFFLVGCNFTKTSLPEKRPNDFSFAVKWSFVGTYDSLTKKLRNGHNYDLNVDCTASLFFESYQLDEIYEIIRNVKIDTYDDVINVSDEVVVPRLDCYIIIRYGDYQKKITLNNVVSEKIVRGKQVLDTINKIVEDYIYPSKAYKSLPANQEFYD